MQVAEYGNVCFFTHSVMQQASTSLIHIPDTIHKSRGTSITISMCVSS